jgi:hypothetical protein
MQRFWKVIHWPSLFSLAPLVFNMSFCVLFFLLAYILSPLLLTHVLYVQFFNKTEKIESIITRLPLMEVLKKPRFWSLRRKWLQSPPPPPANIADYPSSYSIPIFFSFLADRRLPMIADGLGK